MRQLLPTYADEVDLREAYAYPADRTWVRANMVSSLDGSAVQDGRSGMLSSAADKAVFATLRGLCDAVLVGAGTARTEGYRAPRAKESWAEHRRDLGQVPAPTLVLASGRLDLDPGSDLFTGDERTIVMTTARADHAVKARLAEVADVVDVGDEHLDMAEVVAQLTERGLTRVLCEGGPTLLGGVVGAGLLDELCLSLSPKVVGGDGTRIVHGVPLDVSFRPAHLLEDEGVLFGRYVRA